MDGFWRTIKNRGIRRTWKRGREGGKVLKLALAKAEGGRECVGGDGGAGTGPITVRVHGYKVIS